MESDNRTRVYFFEGGSLRVKQAWPQVASDWTDGRDAEQTFLRADFLCSSIGSGGNGNWVVRPNPNERGEQFNVPFCGDKSEEYAHLALKLEQRAGRQGVTILIC